MIYDLLNAKSVNTLLIKDRHRYNGKGVPLFLILFRKCQQSNGILRFIYRCLYYLVAGYRHIEISYTTRIGGGLYAGHAFGITINSHAVLGENINIHKGVTIGRENRGKRRGVPNIGNNVWIGINSCIVGKISIGDDVLIAPNSYVNCDVPSHSVVIGNPCKIISRENATEGYISNPV